MYRISLYSGDSESSDNDAEQDAEMNAAYNVLDLDEFNRNNFDRREETRSRRSQASANQIEINLQPYIIPIDQLGEIGITITQEAFACTVCGDIVVQIRKFLTVMVVCFKYIWKV